MNITELIKTHHIPITINETSLTWMPESKEFIVSKRIRRKNETGFKTEIIGSYYIEEEAVKNFIDNCYK